MRKEERKKRFESLQLMMGRCSQRLRPTLSTDQVLLHALCAVIAIPSNIQTGSHSAVIYKCSNICYKTHKIGITFSQQNVTSQVNADSCKIEIHKWKMLAICSSSAWCTEMPDGYSAVHHVQKCMEEVHVCKLSLLTEYTKSWWTREYQQFADTVTNSPN